MARSSTVTFRSGTVSPRETNGSAPAAASTMFLRPLGWVMGHAPSIAWPHTRMVLPVTALLAGLAK